MERALINIDYTDDFVAVDGALTCGEAGQAIENRVIELTEEFYQAGDYVVFAIDRHLKNDPYHPETKLFPPHNIAGGQGRRLYGGLQSVYDRIRKEANVHRIDKTRYSAFSGTDLDLRLRERGIREVHLVGVCTDICILHTAIDAYNLGYQLVVYQDGVASFNQAGHEWALNHFKTCLGAEIR